MASPSDSLEIPTTRRAVCLEGTGFDRIQLRELPVPRPGPRQLLARVDAAGICTSLIKIAEQGPAHSLIHGWDVEAHPIILGDEGAVTLLEVGEELRDTYRPGERFAVQPAVSHPPVLHRDRYRDGGAGIDRLGVGYTLPGLLADLVLITEETIQGGSLLPLHTDELAHAHVALAEPFSCALSGQDHHLHLVQPDPLEDRQALKGLLAGGVTVVVGAGAMGRMHVDLALSARPARLLVTDLLASRLEKVRSLFGPRARELGVDLVTLDPAEVSVADAVASATDGAGATDVIVAVGLAPVIEEAQHLVGRGGVLNIFGGLKSGQHHVSLDANRVHYRDTVVTGSSGGSPRDVARILELLGEGEIDAGAHIVQVGDLTHVVEFLRRVRDRELDGKAVVYPGRPVDEILTVDSWSIEDERRHLEARAGSARS